MQYLRADKYAHARAHSLFGDFWLPCMTRFPREIPAHRGVSFMWHVKSDPQGSRARRPALSFSEPPTSRTSCVCRLSLHWTPLNANEHHFHISWRKHKYQCFVYLFYLDLVVIVRGYTSISGLIFLPLWQIRFLPCFTYLTLEMSVRRKWRNKIHEWHARSVFCLSTPAIQMVSSQSKVLTFDSFERHFSYFLHKPNMSVFCLVSLPLWHGSDL